MKIALEQAGQYDKLRKMAPLQHSSSSKVPHPLQFQNKNGDYRNGGLIVIPVKSLLQFEKTLLRTWSDATISHDEVTAKCAPVPGPKKSGKVRNKSLSVAPLAANYCQFHVISHSSSDLARWQVCARSALVQVLSLRN